MKKLDELLEKGLKPKKDIINKAKKIIDKPPSILSKPPKHKKGKIYLSKSLLQKLKGWVMFLSKKKFNKLLEGLDNKFNEVDTRLNELEKAVVFLIKKMEESEEGKKIEREENTKLFEALVNKSVDSSKVLGALLKSDEDRIKALNITMEEVERMEKDIGLLAKILNEKGYITIDDFKGD